jgi:hypothetical protein
MIILRGHITQAKSQEDVAVKLVDRVRLSEDTEAHEIGRHFAARSERVHHLLFEVEWRNDALGNQHVTDG